MLIMLFMYKFTDDNLVVNVISTFMGMSMMMFYNRVSDQVKGIWKSFGLAMRERV